MADTTLSTVFNRPNSPPVSINGRTVTGSVAVGTATLANMSAIGKAELSGALTANTWKTVVNITTGAGVVKLANVFQMDTTARSLGIQISLEGVVVYTNYLVPAPTAGHGINAIGATLGASTWQLERIPFNTSFKLEIKSSLTETDKLAYMAIYDLT